MSAKYFTLEYPGTGEAVGRWDLTAPYSRVPAGFAACFEDLAQARRVAASFEAGDGLGGARVICHEEGRRTEIDDRAAALADLDRREAQIRANTKPAYRAVATMCLEQIARERAALGPEAPTAPAAPEALGELIISPRVWGILGLDDCARYPEIERAVGGTRVICRGPRAAVQDLVDEIHDRATEDENGFNESAPAKASCRAAIKNLRLQGWAPRL